MASGHGSTSTLQTDGQTSRRTIYDSNKRDIAIVMKGSA